MYKSEHNTKLESSDKQGDENDACSQKFFSKCQVSFKKTKHWGNDFYMR